MTGLTLLSLLLPLAVRAQYTATYLPSNAPDQSEGGQTGTNQCGTGSNQTSQCQNVYMNGVTDFCLWAPPDPTYEGTPATIGDTEAIEVAWCMRSGYGTRLIPDGTITGAHFIQTPNYVQVLGVGDMTNLNVPSDDDGGELDPHGATGDGNPVGGLVFGTSFGALQQYHEWTNFMWYGGFCFRACIDGPDAPTYCNHIYDTLGCGWNMPGNYSEGIFESCLADNTEPMGVYVVDNSTSTFFQGQSSTPDAHDPAPSSDCSFLNTISNEAATPATATLLPSTVSASISSASVTSVSKISVSSASAHSSSGSGASATSGGTAASASASGGHSGAVSRVVLQAGTVWFVVGSLVVAMFGAVCVL